MHVVSCLNSINVIVNARDAELLLAGLRSLNEKHEHDHTMTPQLKIIIVDAIMRIELSILDIREGIDPKQKLYDILTFNY